MIECTDNYIWYKKRKKKPFKRFFSIFLCFIILFSTIFYYRNLILKQIFNICQDYCYACSTDSVNNAVLLSLDNVTYSELILIEKDNDGEIVMMTTNSLKINSINRKVADKTSSILKNKLSFGVPIPICAFTGISLFSGYGKKVNLKIINNVSVICNFSSTFTSVGINQTLHSIYIDVISVVKLQVPLKSYEIKSKTQILISETVLVGKVPDIYLKEGLFNKNT